jgi:hypothetical protein
MVAIAIAFRREEQVYRIGRDGARSSGDSIDRSQIPCAREAGGAFDPMASLKCDGSD